jgi:hypothetical protein
MSRKITQESISAFLSKKPFKKSNMEVVQHASFWKLKLHGNTIATIDPLNVLSISNAGWESNTTKERLNGLPGVHVKQKNWNWFLNGEQWDGGWKRISVLH